MGAAPEAGIAETAGELPLVAEAYLTHLVVERGRSPRTISAYRSDLARWQGFLIERGLTVDDVSESDVQTFADTLRASGLAPASVLRFASSVRGLHRFLAVEGVRADDPTTCVELPRRPDPIPRALDEAEVAAMLDAAARPAQGGDPVALRDVALLELLYATGARVSEACGLGFGDVDLEAALVRLFGKRSKERIVPLGEPAVAAIGEWLDRGRPALAERAASSGSSSRSRSRRRGSPRDDADAVFLGVRGRRMSRQAAWEVIRRFAREAGLAHDVSPHVLRHSCATHLLDNGADIRTVAELLGHASVSTTQIYTRVATSRLFEAYREAHPRATRRPGAGPSIGTA